MNLATFSVEGTATFGVATAAGFVDAGKHLPGCASLRDALAPEHRATLERLANLPPDHAVVTATLLQPFVPGKVLCVLLNYEPSRLAQGRPKLQYPHIVTRFADCHVGPGQPLVKPAASTEFDFEGEIAVVIGRGGRRITAAAAMDHVAGLTAYNDATPRDWMRHTRHFTAAKNFPSTAALGPWITTLDAFDELAEVGLEVRVNGEPMQSGRLGELTFPIPELVAYTSSFTRLEPGDVIATGTPAGSGYKRMPPRFLRAGDIVDVEVAGVGTLSNPVQEEV